MLSIKRSRTRITASNLLLAFYLLWKAPIIAIYVNTYIAMLLLVAWFFLLLLSKLSKVSFRLKIQPIDAFFLVYVILQLLINCRYSDSFVNAIWSVFLEVVPYVAARVIIENNDKKSAKIVVSIILITYTVTSITTIMGYALFPNASRILAADSTAYAVYYKYNIGGFNFVYSLVITHPMIICLFKKKKKLLISLAYSCLIGACIFLSNYTTASLLFILSCIAYFLPYSNRAAVGKKRIRWIIVFLLVAVWFLPSLLRYISTFDIFSESATKIQDIANLLQGQGTNAVDTTFRRAKYELSIDAFLKYPITGGYILERLTLGGHSFWLDYLGQFGVIGTSFILGLYWCIFKSYFRLSNKSSTLFFSLVSLLLSFILSILNPGLWIFEIAFVVPVFLYMVSIFDDMEEGSI